MSMGLPVRVFGDGLGGDFGNLGDVGRVWMEVWDAGEVREVWDAWVAWVVWVAAGERRDVSEAETDVFKRWSVMCNLEFDDERTSKERTG
jgi:hypothetical protein